MPIDAEKLSKLPPRPRREFDVTDDVYVDLLAFFVEHPDAAYAIDEIRRLAQICSHAYPHLPTGSRESGNLDYLLKQLEAMGLLGSVSDCRYYYMSDNAAAELLLDISGWVEVRETDSRVTGRGLEELSVSDPPLAD